jgi:hypothetical protein
MYVKYSRYIILPSFNSYKIESYCLIEKLESYINNSIENTICFVLYSEKEPLVMFFNEILFNIILYSENSDNTLPEIIMLMKKVEKNKGEIIIV